MGIPERLCRLRAKMREKKIDMFYIPTNDFHGSEYVSDYFKIREFISGFDGSAGTVIVTQEEAGLWTDGRYFLQAEAQLAGSGFTLYKSGQEGVPNVSQYIASKLPKEGVLGMDGRMVSEAWAAGMRRLLAAKNGRLVLHEDLVGQIWTDRPQLRHEKAWLLDVRYAGESREARLARLREDMKRKKAVRCIITSLDEIAWLLNIRGNDIPCNPVVLSYLIVEETCCRLFVGKDVFGEADREELARAGVVCCPYEQVTAYVRRFSENERIMLDKRTLNAGISMELPKGIKAVDGICPVTQWKAVKNSTEVENEKEAHIRDGVAVTKFICWLKRNIDKVPLTEIAAAEKLEEFRRQQKDYLGPSFEPIAGYAEHGAIVHYSATKETDARLYPENFLLLDTGGQYLQGTTDITRTILLGGTATEEQKKYYTAVLRGNIGLCAAKFIYGCSGVALDYAARQPLWELGCNFEHGTGHGVGYLLNVHEGPNAFRYKISAGPGQNPALEEGMITSDEPGIYLEGRFGIRLENLILCVKREKNEYGQFMGFEPLTLVPFEREAIDIEQMSPKEKAWLNAYHERVLEAITPHLNREEQAWLAAACAPV